MLYTCDLHNQTQDSVWPGRRSPCGGVQSYSAAKCHLCKCTFFPQVKDFLFLIFKNTVTTNNNNWAALIYFQTWPPLMVSLLISNTEVLGEERELFMDQRDFIYSSKITFEPHKHHWSSFRINTYPVVANSSNASHSIEKHVKKKSLESFTWHPPRLDTLPASPYPIQPQEFRGSNNARWMKAPTSVAALLLLPSW